MNFSNSSLQTHNMTSSQDCICIMKVMSLNPIQFYSFFHALFFIFYFFFAEFLYLTTTISHIFKHDLTVHKLHFLGRRVKEVLQKRLKNHIKKEKLVQAKLAEEKRMNEVHFYCVIDFQATCEEDNPKDYIHEIIEFPAVLVDATTLEVVSELLRR